MSAEIEIRAERASDEEAIRRVNEAAFGQPGEARLVDELRAADALLLSLVADKAGALIGHVGFVPLRLEGGDDARLAGLAPLAVLPGERARGIGAALVRAGLARLDQAGIERVFVLGDPAYYGRFGFSRAAADGFSSEYDCEAFQGLALAPGPVRRGRLAYPAAFRSA